MISINNLSFYFGSRPLYENANLHIKPKDKIGLVGANGTGKSTLLRIIMGEYQPDEGNISKSGDCTIGFLNQDLLSYVTEDNILTVAMEAFERENEIQRQIDKVIYEMETNYRDELVDKLSRLQEEFEALDGYTMQAKTEEILEGLGFTTNDLQRPLKEFSGGWRMRVMLAKMLLQKPSLLMLDEPTNHLDLPTIQWIENYLSNYEGAIIVVSHDRYFLDNVVESIVEISGGKMNWYSGNYEFYLEEKALRNELQQNAYDNQQAKIRQTEQFINRFKAKASKAKQVQSRVKMLNRIEMIDEVVDENAKVHFKFKFSSPSGRNVLTLDDISKSYPEKEILKHSTIKMERGDKIALIGANGKGKSTILRIIAGNEVIEGNRELGHNVNFSFYAQHQLESLNVENAILDELKQTGTDKSETELRTILGCFLFSNDDAFKKIKVLSGGEKSRVALAKVLISQANFLLLDEPTNHLDMQSVNILIQALEHYEGSYVVVSHDRHFVSRTANKIWYIEDYQIKEYPGTYEEFETWKESREADEKINNQESKKNQTAPKPVEQKTIPSNNTPKPQPKDFKKVNQKLEETEKEMSELEKLKMKTEADLALPENYNKADKLKELNEKYRQLSDKIKVLESTWEELVIEMDENKK